jgi:hypothetical protein
VVGAHQVERVVGRGVRPGKVGDPRHLDTAVGPRDHGLHAGKWSVRVEGHRGRGGAGDAALDRVDSEANRGTVGHPLAEGRNARHPGAG